MGRWLDRFVVEVEWYHLERGGPVLRPRRGYVLIGQHHAGRPSTEYAPWWCAWYFKLAWWWLPFLRSAWKHVRKEGFSTHSFRQVAQAMRWLP